MHACGISIERNALFDLKKLILDVFDPQLGEVVVIGYDLPTIASGDTTPWQERRRMAEEWREAFVSIGAERGFVTLPILTFQATGVHNADLPLRAVLGGKEVAMERTLLDSTLAVFMTEYSATAPLTKLSEKKEDFRAASMPGVAKRMEQSALAADYAEVSRRCNIIDNLIRGSECLEVVFSTGHACCFDLRYRAPEMDDGFLPRFKIGERIINLPAGETFIVPYEGERDDEPSRTQGILPIQVGDELVVLQVVANHIIRVVGDGPEAVRLRCLFAEDSARTNIAEVAFGCNEWAVVSGNVLEDEKAGFHWAYGRSDHLGGITGVDAFRSPETVLHQDIVYATGNPIQVQEATVVREGRRMGIIGEGDYLVFCDKSGLGA
jgi:hypothetical protein